MNKNNYTTLATDEVINTTKLSLEKNGFNVKIAVNGNDAKNIAISLLPQNSEVMTATSVTLESLGLDKAINDSAKYNSVKSKLMLLDRKKDSLEMQKLGAAPEYVIGSVHAVTQDGKVIIASNTGSQLPSYSYGATKVIWVVSTKKITKDLEDGMKRLNNHVLQLESIRVQKAYGMPSSEIKKILIINKELNPTRITIIFVKEDLGY